MFNQTSTKSLLVNQNQEKQKHIASFKNTVDVKKSAFFDKDILTAPKKKKGAFAFFTKADLKKKEEIAAQLIKQKKDDVDRKAEKYVILAKNEVRLSSTNQVPQTEWWDVPYLIDGTKATVVDNLNTKSINKYIQHPARVDCEFYPRVRAETPIMLTKEERKKLQRKKKRQKEGNKREEIKLGLRQPDEPELRYNNYVNILGEMAFQNPTKAQNLVKKAYEKRYIKMRKDNEDRMLTKEQKALKLKNKFEKDASTSLSCCLVVLPNELNKQIKFKLLKNAEQLYLTGMIVINKEESINVRTFALLEGGEKALRKFKNLVEKRISWSAGKAEVIWEGPAAKREMQKVKVLSAKSESQVLFAMKEMHYEGLIPLINVRA